MDGPVTELWAHITLSSGMSLASNLREPSSASDFTPVKLLGESQFFFLDQLNLTVSLYLFTLLKSPFHSIRSINAAITRKLYIFESSFKGIPRISLKVVCFQFPVYFEMVYVSFQLLSVEEVARTVILDLVNMTVPPRLAMLFADQSFLC